MNSFVPSSSRRMTGALLVGQMSSRGSRFGWTEIYINLAKKDVTITTRATTARPGCDEAGKSEFFKALVNDKTQVFHVGSDPYWNRKP